MQVKCICSLRSETLIFYDFRKHGIPWKNIKGYSSDSASVMVGKNNSVLSRVREKTERSVFDLPCVSHIANLCAGQMTRCFGSGVEDLLINTYFWLDKRLVSTEVIKSLATVVVHCSYS